MSVLGIPQAVGITGVLTGAGMSAEEVHGWFNQSRQDLAGLWPAFVLGCPESFPGEPDRILELARQDASALNDRPEGSRV